MANQLRDHPITRIFTSPVPRAIETCEIVAWRLGLSYMVVDALREYDSGVLEGRSDQDAWQKWQDVFNAWYFDQRYDECLEGGEAYTAIRQRFVSFIDDLLKQYAGTEEEILCISHGALYALMLPVILANVDHELLKQYGLDYTFVLVAEHRPEGLVAIEWNGQPVKL